LELPCRWFPEKGKRRSPILQSTPETQGKHPRGKGVEVKWRNGSCEKQKNSTEQTGTSARQFSKPRREFDTEQKRKICLWDVCLLRTGELGVSQVTKKKKDERVCPQHECECTQGKNSIRRKRGGVEVSKTSGRRHKDSEGRFLGRGSSCPWKKKRRRNLGVGVGGLGVIVRHQGTKLREKKRCKGRGRRRAAASDVTRSLDQRWDEK